MRVCMCARMYARAYDCQDTTGHGTPPEHDTPPEKRGTQDNRHKNKICDYWEI